MTNSISQKTQVGKIIIESDFSTSGKLQKFNFEEGVSVNINTLSNIRVLSNLDKIKNINEYYNDFFKTLNLSSSINYREILGRKKSNSYNTYLKQHISSTLKMLNSYHTDIFPKRSDCYKNLSKVTLENKTLELPTYNHSGVTGRTSIIKGFNFLTLKKEKRSLLRPLDTTKCLIEVDFKSCEPFFYIKSQNIEINCDDVYLWICQKYGIEITNREKVKRGLLSMIYGANENVIARIMKVPQSKVKQIKTDLKLYELEEKLQNEYDEKGFFLNYYGRPITSNNNLINYYIQSSAVDFCSLAFHEFSKNQSVKPSFFIHDSMTFQCEKSVKEKIIKLSDIKEPYSKISIPVEFTVITE